MIRIKGFIKEVSQTRDWTDRNGEQRQSVNLVLSFPYVAKDGRELCDEMMGEMTLPKDKSLEGIKKACEDHEKCEIHVGFSLSDWNGKKIQNIRVYNLTRLMM
jgi:hypothetical protein